MEAIQIQTPPKDDEIETPEVSTPMDAIEVEQAPDESEPETPAEEIIVEQDKEPDNQNGNEDDASSLSSAPDSDGEHETSKTSMSLHSLLTMRHQRKEIHAPLG